MTSNTRDDVCEVAQDVIRKAGEIGLNIYPVKMPSGRFTFGGRKSWHSAHTKLNAFYDGLSDGLVDPFVGCALADTISLDARHSDWTEFNDLASRHWDLPRLEGDAHLLARCKLLRDAICRENEKSCELSDAITAFEAEEPKRPLIPARDCPVSNQPERDSSREMKEHLKKALWLNGKDVLDRYRDRIRNVVEYEREIERLRKKHRLNFLEGLCEFYSERLRYLGLEIAVIPAQTLVGMAAKTSLVQAIHDRGCENDYFDELVLSLANDARLLGTSYAARPARMKRVARTTDHAEAYHAVAAE